MRNSYVTRARGFSLLEMAVVLAIMGLLASAILPAVSVTQEQLRRKETIAKLSVAEQALVSFVMVNRRLPCPADGSLPGNDPNAGVSQPNGAGVCLGLPAQRGVLPWRTLGLAESDALDGWNVRFTYRVATGANGVTHAGAMDGHATDPATGLGALLGVRGLRVVDESLVALSEPGTPPGPGPGTGAAYVLISHGRYGGGGYNSGGVLQLSDVAPGTNERWNLNNAAVRLPPLAYFHDSRYFDDGGGVNHFDDLIVHPSILTVMTRAQLAPRAP